MFLYQDVFNSKYAEDYANTLGIEASSLSDLMRGQDSVFADWFNDLYLEVSLHYKSVGICESQLSHQYCAFSNLTNNQWLNQTVLMNPLEG